MPEANVQAAVTNEQFEARIEAVRKRFVAKFADRMRQTVAALPGMTGDGAVPADIVANAYHWLHEISGIAATIGYASTGRSARACDDFLIGPYRAQRGLSAAELAQLTDRLDSLRRAAQAEMQILE
jgi:hypothetical protein